ncbi:MAG TPA: hypothetical protein VHO06_28510 [Polyangia bacterium]|nr:hypothetical protein [Polyangia bacterium]
MPARAADPKSKKKSTSDSDDKVIDKQLQWEDSVMGPDDKRAELEKIARAQAINKAAAEKAAREKEKADAQAAREKEKADAAPKTAKRGGDVALPTLPDEDSGQGNKARNGKSSEVSPKLETAAAAAPPPPVKHGDDKFIDKLLKDDGGAKKHRASTADDKALDDLLATDKPAAPKKGKKDDVDALLAAKPKPVVPTHVKHDTPEWEKPEIESTPVEAPIAVRQQPKKDDGIIHVVQGAANTGHAVPAAHHTVAAPPPARTTSYANNRASANRRQASSAPSGSWDDPFADSSRPKKNVAARHDDSGADALDDFAPVRRRAPASSRSGRGGDEANDNAKTTGTRRATPAAKPKWKDPFTEGGETHVPARTAVASRETHKPESKWESAAPHHTAAAAEPPSRSGRWGVLKKHAH